MRKKRSVKEILERRKRRTFDHSNEVLIGKVVGVHGIKGEMKVKSESDIFERQIEATPEVSLYRGTKHERLEIEDIKPYKDIYLIKFKGIEDRSSAEERMGGEIYIKKEEQVPLEEGEFYYHQLIGLKVLDESGREVGTVKSIFEQPASHILEVETPKGKTILIPFIDHFVKEVNLEKGQIVVSLIEGMEE